MHWQNIIGEEKQKAYFVDLMNFVEKERASGQVIYPPQCDVFNAFKYTTPQNLKVVILGQDPYHGPNQAHGLCFSALKGNKVPPSLRNIYKELASDIEGFVIPNHGELTSWANQGVLLLNTVMTVKEGHAHSHKNKGWEVFTDAVITKLNSNFEGLIFLLWGSPAQKKASAIDDTKHHILRSVHPSPLSAHRGFFGNKHFSQTNALLSEKGKKPIDWHLPIY